jgi:hypothetical protein
VQRLPDFFAFGFRTLNLKAYLISAIQGLEKRQTDFNPPLVIKTSLELQQP